MGILTKASLAVMTIFLVSVFHDASGFDCVWGGSQGFLDKINPLNPKSCPTLLNTKGEMFCCEDKETGIGICCDFQDYLGNVNLILIGVGLVVLILLLAIACRCFCPCC